MVFYSEFIIAAGNNLATKANLFIQHLLNTCYISGSILSTGRTENKIKSLPSSSCILVERDSTEIKYVYCDMVLSALEKS